MATVTIRNLDDEVVAALKRQAKARHRSLEAELRDLVTQHVEQEERRVRLIETARRIRAQTPLQRTDSTDLIREDRDR